MISVLVVERSLSLNSLLSSSLSSLLLSVELELLGPICPQLEQVCLREGLNRFASVNDFLDYIRTLRGGGEGESNEAFPECRWVEVGQNVVVQPRQQDLAAGVIEATVTNTILAHHTE